MRKITNLLVLVSLFFGVVIINSCKKDVVVPTLTTTTATSITINSASSGGVITNNGGADVTVRGVCYSTTSNPTISGSKTSDGSGSGSFTSNLTSLAANTKYYVKAYATNSAGTGYGNEVSFTTGALVVPTLTTAEITEKTLTSATSGGNITADGGAAVTARGVCWGITTAPTIAGDKTADGSGTGTFASAISGLTPATVYYVRAYATNSVGTAYGNEISFTTLATSAPVVTTDNTPSVVTLTSATIGGNVTSDGGVSVTARGICYATTTSPTIANNKTSNGAGTGAFTGEITGLNPGVKYYARAYATNSVGTSYGNEIDFTTTAVVAPTVTTAAMSAVEYTTATSGGNVTADGGGLVTARGVCWATTADPTTADHITSNATGLGVFTSNLTNLTPGTDYHVRAYATNSAGTSYGADVPFTTKPIVLATLTTTAASAFTQTTAASGGNITDNGGGAISVRGVCWSVNPDPTTSDPKTDDGPGSGVFTSAITGLLPGTIYHIRAYAVNSAGVSYGNDLNFTTNPVVLATLTTATISAVTMTSATSGGNITNSGGADITARGICWSTTSGPTTANSVANSGTGTGVFAADLTSLLPGTTYYVKAFATNSLGTAYGNELSFTTNPVVSPTVATTAASLVTLTTATSGGNVTDNGGATVTERGICFALTQNPTITNTTIPTGAGTGIFTSNLTALGSGETYYVRAYATNSAGTGYGNQIVISTQIADIEGTAYNTVQIGTQLWMAENLKTITFNTGALIPNVTDNTAWAALATPAYSWFNNNEAVNKPLYGALYNFFAVNTGNLCPTGWHAPFDEDFNTLESFLGVPPAEIDLWGVRGTDQGSQMKSTTGWLPGQNGTNTSGFTAIPGGYRFAANGAFNDLGNLTYFWTNSTLDATRSWYRLLTGTEPATYRAATEQEAGKYVRCVKD